MTLFKVDGAKCLEATVDPKSIEYVKSFTKFHEGACVDQGFDTQVPEDGVALDVPFVPTPVKVTASRMSAWATAKLHAVNLQNFFTHFLVGGGSTASLRGRLVGAPKRQAVKTRVSYLSEVEDESKKKKWWDNEDPDREESNPRDHSGVGEVDSNYGPKDYVGFVDAEGFDGGDGQVGVVGDGKNHMEEFDYSEAVEKRRKNAVGGSESKTMKAKVAWGQTTGYADELKKRGMVEYDEYGEDKLAQRRQQLENFKGQQEVRMQKDAQMSQLAELQGKKYQPLRHGSYLASMDSRNQVVSTAGVKVDPSLAHAFEKDEHGHDIHVVEGGSFKAGEITDTIRVSAMLNGRGGTSIFQKNDFTTYDDFKAGFVAGSSSTISVSPTSGTLNRRSGEPQEFIIKFQPQSYEESYEATLVIETDEAKWTYPIFGTLK